jgi:hypothetical protein
MSRKSMDVGEELTVNLMFGCQLFMELINVVKFWLLGHRMNTSSMYRHRRRGF